MGITYTVGDATRPTAEGRKCIVHCVNDIGVWGAGFVLALDKRWEQPGNDFREASSSANPLQLGDVQYVTVEPDTIVTNLCGQHRVGTIAGRPAVRYDAIWEGCREINAMLTAIGERETIASGALDAGPWSIHMPMMGAGLAGGAWPIIEAIVEDRFPVIPVTVYVLSPRDLPNDSFKSIKPGWGNK